MGKFNKHLECKKHDTIELCPICNSMKKPHSEWPEMGTHAFTIPYDCGTEIDYPIGSNGAMYGVSCDGQVKRFVQPSPRDLSPEKWEELAQKFRDIDSGNSVKPFKIRTQPEPWPTKK